MKLSVVVVTYNHKNFINDTLQSIVDQTVDFNMEVWVADDCSTDGTREIVLDYQRRYPHLIKPLFNEVNLGAIQNYFNALAFCQGEYIAHMDGDDLMLPTKLQKQVDFLDTHPECALCFHLVTGIDEHGKKSRIYRAPEIFKTFDLDGLIRNGSVFTHSSKMFRKSAIPPEGFDTSVTRVGDYLWHIQNACYGDIGLLKEVLGVYRVNSAGFTLISRASYEKAHAAIEDQIYAIDYAKKHKGVSEPTYSFGLAHIYYNLALWYMTFGYKDKFIETIELSYATNPKFINKTMKRKLRFFMRNYSWFQKIRKK
jgi:glycosyltransferase involved in cell wall biosynthesis